MAKTKEITIGEQKFTLQSVSPSWYYDFNDECGNTGNGKRKSIREKEYTFEITAAFCNECGGEMGIPGLMDYNIKEIDEQYRSIRT